MFASATTKKMKICWNMWCGAVQHATCMLMLNLDAYSTAVSMFLILSADRCRLSDGVAIIVRVDFVSIYLVIVLMMKVRHHTFVCQSNSLSTTKKALRINQGVLWYGLEVA